jgi:hypothetical protein
VREKLRFNFWRATIGQNADNIGKAACKACSCTSSTLRTKIQPVTLRRSIMSSLQSSVD